MCEKILNKCPLCGSRIKYMELCQYSEIFLIKKNGELSKHFTKDYYGSMECGCIVCTNDRCNFKTDFELNVSDEVSKNLHNKIHIYMKNDGVFYYEEIEKLYRGDNT